jgi:hypothetical protein
MRKSFTKAAEIWKFTAEYLRNTILAKLWTALNTHLLLQKLHASKYMSNHNKLIGWATRLFNISEAILSMAWTGP